MQQRVDLAVFIGRFQPFHNGHRFAIQRAMQMANHVLVLVGDTGGPRSTKDPWTFAERRQMIMRAMPSDTVSAPDCAPRVIIRQLMDDPNDQEWLANVQAEVAEAEITIGTVNSVVLVGHNKDQSSYYLKMFPQWDFKDTGYDLLYGGNDSIEYRVDATEIRELYFKERLQYATGVLPREVLDHMMYLRSMNRSEFEELKMEYEAVQKYRKSWAAAPFPPVFVTTDAVVIQSGHILMVKRGERPGKGLWALPGGFIDQTETIEDCAIRELIEETEINLQPEVLRRCIKYVQVFDRAGGVSSMDRGRIFTHAHLIKLNDSKDLPKVRGADDAEEAKWIPIADLDGRQIFSDHYNIIRSILGKL